MGTEPQNALPNDANNDEDLANSFADFFHSKVEKIYEILLVVRLTTQKVMILQNYAGLHQWLNQKYNDYEVKIQWNWSNPYTYF